MTDVNSKSENRAEKNPRENPSAENQTTDNRASGDDAARRDSSAEKPESLEEKERKVEKETQKNSRDVSKVRDELKREKLFNSYNSWLSVINFALLVMLIFGLYIYESSNNAKTKTRIYDTRAQVLRVEERVQSLSEADKVAAISIQNLATESQDLDERVSTLDRQLLRVQGKVDEAAKRLENATPGEQKKEIRLTDPETLMLNEARYLIKLANRKMYLEHDTTVAVTLLRDADSILAEVDDPGIIPVRRGIASDITKLSGLEQVDTETLVIRLSALEENVKNLPVLNYKVNFDMKSRQEESAAPQEVSEDISDWRDNLAGSMNRFFGSLMVIRKNDTGNHHFLSADEVAILHDKIALILMQAQLAVYSQQQTAYEQNLAKAASLIEEYYDRDDAGTIQMLNELGSLQSQSVIFIGVQQFDSLNKLREFYKKSGRM